MTDAEFSSLKIERIESVLRYLYNDNVILDEPVPPVHKKEPCLNCQTLYDEHANDKCLYEPTYYQGEDIISVWIIMESNSFSCNLYRCQFDYLNYAKSRC